MNDKRFIKPIQLAELCARKTYCTVLVPHHTECPSKPLPAR